MCAIISKAEFRSGIEKKRRERVCYFSAYGKSNSPKGLNLEGNKRERERERERERHLGGIIPNCLAVGVIAHGTIP